jgi:hypothetical protein
MSSSSNAAGLLQTDTLVYTTTIPQGGGWLDTTNLPDGPVRMVVSDENGNIFAEGLLNINNSPLTQVLPTDDPFTIRNTYDNTFVTELYQNQSTLEIEYREVDLMGNIVTLLRPATAAEITLYNFNKLAVQNDLALAAAKQNLQGEPENGGANYQTWVTNRISDLQSCEADMLTGQGTDFAGLGANGQNQTIHRIEQCNQLNSRILRQVISNLYDLLVAEGILTP